jgi:hypothetical protein
MIFLHIYGNYFVECESYDPLSLVSVGLDDEDEEYEDDNAAESTLAPATCSFCKEFIRIYLFTHRKA